MALSPDIKTIKDNTTISGYNTSWLWKNSTFLTGNIPVNLHVPMLQEGRDGGADCISCHNVGDLGAHRDINSEAPGSVNAVNKACWACHGEGKEPRWHPANYKKPRICESCHVEQEMTLNATYIGDERHGSLENCGSCHISDTHRLIRFNVVPTIRTLSLSSREVTEGEKITLNATATAGYGMKIRGAEYYIDSPARTFPVYALDGTFDELTEELTAEIDTSGLAPGNHAIYIRAMERDNKWSPVANVTFELKEKGVSVAGGKEGLLGASLWSVLAAFIFVGLMFFASKRHGQ